MEKRFRLRITAAALMDTLGVDLYADHSACIWEIVRNAICAQMAKDGGWQSGVGRVDVSFEADFPFNQAPKHLVVLDGGRGFHADDLERFCSIGPSTGDLKRNPRGGNGGASQKRIGRFAALALNERCAIGRETNTGFVVVTRTASSGPVLVISVIPADIEENQGMDSVELDGNSPQLGFLSGRKGSFTAVVIPHPVFKTQKELEEGLAWRLPRRKGSSFKLMVCGKQVFPPPLAHAVNLVHGPVEIHAAKRLLNDEGGMWFTDKESGLRVAEVRKIGTPVPHPFGSYDLVGDIFIPNLLANQDSSRVGLSHRYLSGQEWRWNVMPALNTQVGPLRALLGIEEADTTSSPIRESVTDVAKMFNTIFGAPTISAPVEPSTEVEVERVTRGDAMRTRVRNPDTGNGGGTTRTTARNAEELKKERKLVQGTALRIGDASYLLMPMSLSPHIFAEVEGDRIWINERGYSLLPAASAAKREHIITCLLMAVASSHYPASVDQALRWVAERRAEMQKKKK